MMLSPSLRHLRTKLGRLLELYEVMLSRPLSEVGGEAHWPEWMSKITALLSLYDGLQREVAHGIEQINDSKAAPDVNSLHLIPNHRAEGNFAEGIPVWAAEHVPNVFLRTRVIPEVESFINESRSKNSTKGMSLIYLSEQLDELLCTMKDDETTTTATTNDEDMRIDKIDNLSFQRQIDFIYSGGGGRIQ